MSVIAGAISTSREKPTLLVEAGIAQPDPSAPHPCPHCEDPTDSAGHMLSSCPKHQHARDLPEFADMLAAPRYTWLPCLAPPHRRPLHRQSDVAARPRAPPHRWVIRHPHITQCHLHLFHPLPRYPIRHRLRPRRALPHLTLASPWPAPPDTLCPLSRILAYWALRPLFLVPLLRNPSPGPCASCTMLVQVNDC